MDSNSFVKNTISMFLRLTGYHIMCLMVSLSILAFFPGVAGGFVAQAFCLGIIIILPYLTMWKKGDSDYNLVNYKDISRTKFYGFKVGFLAYCPFLLLCVALIIAKFGFLPESTYSWFKMIFSPFVPFNQSVMPATFTFAEQSFGSVIVAAIVPFAVPCSVGMGYFMGFSRISFSETFKLVDKDKSK